MLKEKAYESLGSIIINLELLYGFYKDGEKYLLE